MRGFHLVGIRGAYLAESATSYFVDSPKVSDTMVVANNPMMITTFLPQESDTCPQKYPVKNRPSVKALPTAPA